MTSSQGGKGRMRGVGGCARRRVDVLVDVAGGWHGVEELD